MTAIVNQRARCDCVVAAIAMYCGVDYGVIWRSMTRRERWVMSYGQGMFFLPMARIVHNLTGHCLMHVAGNDFEPPGFPVFVIVKSSLVEDATHCVYWDGEHLLDPQPLGRLPETWPGPDRLVALYAALHHFDDPDDDFDWLDWVKGAEPMSLDGALGRSYARGLLPWR